MKNTRNSIQLMAVGLLAAAIAGCASVPNAPQLDKTQALDPKDVATVRQDVEGGERAAAIAWRMAVAGQEYCGKYAENVLPLFFGSVPAQTPAGEKLAYWKTYQIEEGSLYVTGVLDQEVDTKLKFDRIISIGEALPPETARRSVLEALRAESARGSLSLTMERAGKVSIPLEKGCRGYFMLVRLDKPMAAIGETTIVMSTGLSAYAKSDDELAFMIGRELALNNSSALGNINAAGYAGAAITGVVRAFIPFLPVPFGGGGILAMSAVRAAYEGVADRGAFELMVKAGYDPRVIPAFWSRVENDEKADHKALRASDARKKAWGEMIALFPIALFPQKAFDQMTATRNASEAKTHTDDKIQSIVQLERNIAR